MLLLLLLGAVVTFVPGAHTLVCETLAPVWLALPGAAPLMEWACALQKSATPRPASHPRRHGRVAPEGQLADGGQPRMVPAAGAPPAGAGFEGATLKVTVQGVSMEAIVQSLPGLKEVVAMVEHLADEAVLPPCKVSRHPFPAAPHFSF